jgi:hypothetical protein
MDIFNDILNIDKLGKTITDTISKQQKNLLTIRSFTEDFKYKHKMLKHSIKKVIKNQEEVEKQKLLAEDMFKKLDEIVLEKKNGIKSDVKIARLSYDDLLDRQTQLQEDKIKIKNEILKRRLSDCRKLKKEKILKNIQIAEINRSIHEYQLYEINKYIEYQKYRLMECEKDI